MNVRQTIIELCQAARKAARATAAASTGTKNRCLRDAAAQLRTARPRLLAADREKTGDGVLALGDPDYETDGGGSHKLARMNSGVAFVPLPGTREEAKAVGDVVLLGSEATAAGLRFAVSRRPRWRAVHLACHGLVDPARPMLSSLALTPTPTVEIAGYQLRFDGLVEHSGANFHELAAKFTVSRGDAVIGVMEPSKRSFSSRQMTTTEAALLTRGASQLYLSLGDSNADGSIAVRLYYKPMVLLIWLGSVVMMLGGALSLSDRRLRVGAPKPATKSAAKSALQPAE